MAYSIGSYVNILSHGLLDDEEQISPPAAPEIDTIHAKITSNIVQTLNGMTLPYAGAGHTVTAAFARLKQDVESSSYPFICVQSLGAEQIHEASRNKYWLFGYHLICQIVSYDTSPETPIAQVCQNVPGYIVEQLMTDTTRGGNALDTTNFEYDDVVLEYSGYYEYAIWMSFEVKVYISKFDMHLRSG